VKLSTILAIALALFAADSYAMAPLTAATATPATSKAAGAVAHICDHNNCKAAVAELTAQLKESKADTQRKVGWWLDEEKARKRLQYELYQSSDEVNSLKITNTTLTAKLKTALDEIGRFRALLAARDEWLALKERELNLWRSGKPDLTSRPPQLPVTK